MVYVEDDGAGATIQDLIVLYVNVLSISYLLLLKLRSIRKNLDLNLSVLLTRFLLQPLSRSNSINQSKSFKRVMADLLPQSETDL